MKKIVKFYVNQIKSSSTGMVLTFFLALKPLNDDGVSY